MRTSGAGGHPKVLFIGGYGRSGSTLLDRILGQIEGFTSAGELRHLWREGVAENRRCGCGEPFHACEFWNRVMERAYGGKDEARVRHVLAAGRHVDRYWRIPQIVGGLGSARFKGALGTYTAALSRLYRAIAEVAGASVVVDSSKDVSHGYLLTRVPGIDLRVCHLVRDSRAVAYSWQRKRFHPGSGGDMERYPVLKTGAEWDVINVLTALLKRRASRYLLLRYQDLVGDPRGAVAGVLDLLDESERSLPFTGASRVDLGVDHTVAGNPIRFRRGPTEVRADDEWRGAMAGHSRSVVTALTWPVLARYGFER